SKPLGMASPDPGEEAVHISHPRHEQQPLPSVFRHPFQKGRHRRKGAPPIQGGPQPPPAKQAGFGERKSVMADRQNHAGHLPPSQPAAPVRGGSGRQPKNRPPSAAARSTPDLSSGSPF